MKLTVPPLSKPQPYFFPSTSVRVYCLIVQSDCWLSRETMMKDYRVRLEAFYEISDVEYSTNWILLNSAFIILLPPFVPVENNEYDKSCRMEACGLSSHWCRLFHGTSFWTREPLRRIDRPSDRFYNRITTESWTQSSSIQRLQKAIWESFYTLSKTTEVTIALSVLTQGDQQGTGNSVPKESHQCSQPFSISDYHRVPKVASLNSLPYLVSNKLGREGLGATAPESSCTLHRPSTRLPTTIHGSLPPPPLPVSRPGFWALKHTKVLVQSLVYRNRVRLRGEIFLGPMLLERHQIEAKTSAAPRSTNHIADHIGDHVEDHIVDHIAETIFLADYPCLSV